MTPRTPSPRTYRGRAVGILAGLWALSIPATLAALATACRTLDADDWEDLEEGAE